jgi:hypothetical protein
MLTSTAIRKANLPPTHHKTHLKPKYKYFRFCPMERYTLEVLTRRPNAQSHVFSSGVSKTLTNLPCTTTDASEKMGWIEKEKGGGIPAGSGEGQG